MKKVWMLACILACVLLFVAACSKDKTTITTEDGKTTISKDGKESSFEGKDGSSVKVTTDNDEDNVVLSGKDTDGKEFNTEVSEKQELPKGLPEFIPFPENITITNSITSTVDNKKSISVLFSTELTFEQLKELYTSFTQKNNMTETSDLATNELVMVTGSIDNASFSLVGSPNTDDSKKVDVILSWVEE